MSNNMVWRLLRHNISAGQLAGYALANLVGLAIVLIAVQFYRDVTTVWNDEDSFISNDYLIISKKVTGLGSIFGSDEDATKFTSGEINDIASQPWAKKVGQFTSAAFNVYAKVDFGGNALQSALFLESIPDDYFDVSPQGWDYKVGSDASVPIIISKDYLTLYNFGFATSRGMPQVSEEMIGMVPLKLSLSGNGRQQWVNARIAGFSSRLNTIAVPEEFMEWANRTFADQPVGNPSRLIIMLDGAGDPAVESYLDKHSYESAGDKADNGKAAYFLSVVTTVVITVGAIISVLAFFILLLSIYLLLQKNRDKLHDLMQLGYSPARVSRYYKLIVVMVNVAVYLLAVTAVVVAAHTWSGTLSALGIESSSVIPTLLIGLGIMLVITVGNLITISRKVRLAFRN
ncbi:MAG: ABC transporter permease [Duncaniella sp.]|nr:ABC transporter permease [Duncaniella sp.]